MDIGFYTTFFQCGSVREEARAELKRLNAKLVSGTSTADLTDEEREIFFRVVRGKDPMGGAG